MAPGGQGHSIESVSLDANLLYGSPNYKGKHIKNGCVDQLKVEMMTRVAVNVIKIFTCVPKKNIGEEPTRYKTSIGHYY